MTQVRVKGGSGTMMDEGGRWVRVRVGSGLRGIFKLGKSVKEEINCNSDKVWFPFTQSPCCDSLQGKEE